MAFTFLILMFLLLSSGSSYKILGIFPHPASSHVAVFYPLMKGLAEKGHQVTFVSNYKYPDKIPTLEQRIIQKPADNDLVDTINIGLLTGSRLQKWSNNLVAMEWGRYACNNLASETFQHLINGNEEYDIVVMEFFNTDCFVPLAHKFGAHLIGLSSCTIMQWSNDRFANIYNPAYIPIAHLEFSDQMSFFERLENTFMVGVHNIWLNHYLRWNDERIARQYFKHEFPAISDIVHNASAFLVNTHFSLNLPRPLVPQVIDVGGIHVGEVQRLPTNLEKWINESSHGVIYFSLGSMIKGHTFPEEKRREFLKAFSRLPQRVLWKYENETMPGKPDNVMIQKWMPQLDILCHPNVKAFISHGGLLGTTEAVHCGVPVMVMPQFGDQFTNAKALEATGGGVILHLDDVTEDTVYNSLNTILDPKFKKQAEELSERFRDRPLPPLETAIYWVEYVARHKGAHHMRTAAVGMPLYKYLLLDVIAFLLLTTTIVIYITFLVLRAICRKLFFQKPKSLTKQKKH